MNRGAYAKMVWAVVKVKRTGIVSPVLIMTLARRAYGEDPEIAGW